MKKKIIIAASAAALVTLTIWGFFYVRGKQRFTRAEEPHQTSHKQVADGRVQDVLETEKDVRDGEFGAKTRGAAAAPVTKNEAKDRFYDNRKKGADDEIALGRVFNPAATAAGATPERKLEYNIHANYQIDTIKSARAFFNQWIPRYGFLLNESASGYNNGYMTLTVRVRSANLYAALTELDGIGNLTSESVTVQDHTENAVHQQMIVVREDIRNRRRSLAAAQTGTQAKNWEATENLLSQTEDKQLATRMEEWRINDRIGWATIQITLSLPAVAMLAPVEVPEFRNAFVGLLNVLLQVLYAAIYLIPLIAIGYIAYRAVLRILPAVRKLVPDGGSRLS